MKYPEGTMNASLTIMDSMIGDLSILAALVPAGPSVAAAIRGFMRDDTVAFAGRRETGATQKLCPSDASPFSPRALEGESGSRAQALCDTITAHSTPGPLRRRPLECCAAKNGRTFPESRERIRTLRQVSKQLQAMNHSPVRILCGSKSPHSIYYFSPGGSSKLLASERELIADPRVRPRGATDNKDCYHDEDRLP